MTLCALVVGSGWGAHAARAFALDPRVRLAALVGQGSDRTLLLGADLAVPIFADLRDAIRRVRPEIAAVAAGEAAHAGMVRELLVSGCHVLCAHPVATEAKRVTSLAETARRHGRIAVADYTLPLTPAYQAAHAALERSGALLRASIQAPGRALAMAIEIAMGFAGPVARVLAASDYPQALADRRRRYPRSFPPSLLLAHDAGCVTSITPVPHAAPATAHRITLSAEGARIDLALPAGEVRVVLALGRGFHSERVERPAAPPASAMETFGAPMRAVARRFVDTVLEGAPPHAPLEHEAEVRRVWAAAQAAGRLETWVPVGA